MKFLLFLILLGSQLLLPLTGQDTASFNRVREYDVQHYRIGVRFNRARKTVYGDATVVLKPIADGLKVVELDARDIKFTSVEREDTREALEYSYDKRKIRISFARPLSPDEAVPIRFLYSARPKKGIYFVKRSREGGRKIHSAQIWTQGEAEETRHWLPSYDFPDDKATTELIITVAKNETVIGNGELVSDTQNKNGTRTLHFKMSIPHSLYLASFVVGEYVKIEDKYRDIPLGYYVYPSNPEIAGKAFSRTKDMMKVFEGLTGIEYPYNKYDQTIVARFPFGGMENVTATTFADSEILLADSDFGSELVVDLVSHELAHSWFGNLVTCRNWAELWTNESFASFMEAAYREKAFGKNNYIAKIEDDAAEYFFYAAASDTAKHGLYNSTADPENDSSMFDPVTYNKGSAVIHTLRREIGEEAFWKGVNLYLNRFKYGNVETSDVRKVFEETSGMDLGWFFEQWIYRTGHPQVLVSQSFDAGSGILKLVFEQTPQLSGNRDLLYRLPLEITVVTSQGTHNEKLVLDEKSEVLEVHTKVKPSLLEIDKRVNVPVKEVIVLPLETIE